MPDLNDLKLKIQDAINRDCLKRHSSGSRINGDRCEFYNKTTAIPNLRVSNHTPCWLCHENDTLIDTVTEIFRPHVQYKHIAENMKDVWANQNGGNE